MSYHNENKQQIGVCMHEQNVLRCLNFAFNRPQTKNFEKYEIVLHLIEKHHFLCQSQQFNTKSASYELELF